jgi:hypothetical protein
MARGPSGRLVIEVDPALKHNLHAALAADGTTLKEWFLVCVSTYLRDRLQPNLPMFDHIEDRGLLQVAESTSAYEKDFMSSEIDHHSTTVIARDQNV